MNPRRLQSDTRVSINSLVFGSAIEGTVLARPAEMSRKASLSEKATLPGAIWFGLAQRRGDLKADRPALGLQRCGQAWEAARVAGLFAGRPGFLAVQARPKAR